MSEGIWAFLSFKRKKTFPKPREFRDSQLSSRESTFLAKGSWEGIHILLGIWIFST
jgi:hypothetical protein